MANDIVLCIVEEYWHHPPPSPAFRRLCPYRSTRRLMPLTTSTPVALGALGAVGWPLSPPDVQLARSRSKAISARALSCGVRRLPC